MARARLTLLQPPCWYQVVAVVFWFGQPEYHVGSKNIGRYLARRAKWQYWRYLLMEAFRISRPSWAVSGRWTWCSNMANNLGRTFPGEVELLVRPRLKMSGPVIYLLFIYYMKNDWSWQLCTFSFPILNYFIGAITANTRVRYRLLCTFSHERTRKNSWG